MNRQQAILVDHVQAVKVQLAIRWNVPVSEISDRRVRYDILKALATKGEEVVAFQ